jgi:hypothetical protein
VRVKGLYFYETLKTFNDFSRENHGHGRHEHGVRRGVFGGKLSFKKMCAGRRLCTLQENPNFWVPTIKVRPPDSTVKGSNFGPGGNFGPFFQKGLLSSKRVLQKKEGIYTIKASNFGLHGSFGPFFQKGLLSS